MLREKLEKVIAKNALLFADKQDINRVLEQLEEVFELRGSTLINRKNSQQVLDEAFELNVLQVARPFLSVKSLGRFVPKFIDSRTFDQKEAAKADVQNLVKWYFEKLGFVFHGEHLDKRDLRDAIASRISDKFLYEAGDSEGKVVFRKVNQTGMFSEPFDPIEVINYFASQFLDRKRSVEKREDIMKKLRRETLETMGVTSESQLNPIDQQAFKDRVDELFTESLNAYTRKKLPVASSFEYQEEYQRRTLHKLGLTDIRLATLHESRKIAANVEEHMSRLNSYQEDLSSIEAIKNSPLWERWTGLTSTENSKGLVLDNVDV